MPPGRGRRRRVDRCGGALAGRARPGKFGRIQASSGKPRQAGSWLRRSANSKTWSERQARKRRPGRASAPTSRRVARGPGSAGNILKFFFPPIGAFQGVAGKRKSPQADRRPLRPPSGDLGEAAREPAPAAPGTSRFAARDDRWGKAPVEDSPALSESQSSGRNRSTASNRADSPSFRPARSRSSMGSA